ncbi:hotdog fold thioesterase [Endozoicomonas numazuensis]|uniref:hotdog fold thioesterase n=1 Tax=Endozoicomonas numazuensis TaxID=1137799 RepID=UPI00055619A1|nr:hotdog fold thioesterase [Endozoicomonas numazuensis]
MSIWKTQATPESLNQRMEGNMCSHVGIKIVEIGDDFVRGTMPVDERAKQPAGLLHGGASVVLAETLGSMGANLCCAKDQYCVGLEINANHLKSALSGEVTGTAKAVHIGRSTQVWEIRIENEQGQLVCISRLTMSAISR